MSLRSSIVSTSDDELDEDSSLEAVSVIDANDEEAPPALEALQPIDDPIAPLTQPPPPPYDENRGRLIRITPAQNARYHLARSDRPVPEGWMKCVHPEGQLYFWHPEKQVVTETFLFNNILLGKAEIRIQQILNSVEPQLGARPERSELYLELDQADSDTCRYYFVNHDTQSLFWLDAEYTGSLNLPPVSSDDHLSRSWLSLEKIHRIELIQEMVMEELYWNHVEYFPMHFQLGVGAESRLRGLLAHAALDTATSDDSTAPYTMEQCRDFQRILASVPNDPECAGPKNFVIARLLAEFCSNRVVHHAGEISARLGRNQNLVEVPEYRNTFFLSLLSTICFMASESYRMDVENIWVDEIAYSVHWRKLVDKLLIDWQYTTKWSAALFLLNSILLAISRQQGSLVTGIRNGALLVALASSAGSIASGVFLVQRHQRYVGTHATQATEYLAQYRHQTYGFRPMGIFFAMPWASQQWCLIATALQLLLLPFQLDGIVMKIMVWVIIVVVIIMVIWTMLFFRDSTAMESDEEASLWGYCRAMFRTLRRPSYTEIPRDEP
ncbi:hypothetical protein SISSUDRAFT_1034422 [Sistotremastrum suecicum HHB10207 ss-3]|uniref:WW domain-containing protein n=1 Tax=Sistotremastrum suecicum HHB10207 ss-3 TaxID=1314776 RepID=A0A166C3P2_9AGAM|nr:hypothetical protein SISSUDRAFT_1034422 [Sistotremastrum suecicum HHB10207 ss-3]